MLVDLDYFFAQVEEKVNSSLKGKPVVVCVFSGRTEDSGAVSTANYLARSYGVRSGMPIALAKRKLESTNAVFLPLHYELYEETSERIMAILAVYADRFEQVGIDEAYLDVTQKVYGDFEQAKALALRIKNEVNAQERLTCSIGIGPNKLISKMASVIQKPDGLTVVNPDQVKSFLSPLLVDQLVGVGTKTKEKMEDLGIRTIGDLAKFDLERLFRVFGKKQGIYFHNSAMGVDEDPVKERGETESVSRISTLKEDTRDLAVIVDKVNPLCNEIYEEIKQKELGFKSVGIIVVMADMSVHSRSKTLDNRVQDLDTFKKTVKELFGKLLAESEIDVRRVGVKISSLSREKGKQEQLESFIDSKSE